MLLLRHLLVVLLCLSVPSAGWASVAGGPLEDGQLGKHSHATHHETPPGHAAGSHADAHLGAIEPHCADLHGACPGKKCPGRCNCGCGMGACSAGSAIAFSAVAAILNFGVNAGIPPPPETRFVGARGTSPLRPPIS